MEELFYLPPRAQAPIINYGVVVGSRLRLAKGGAHNRAFTAPLSRRCLDRSCHFVLLSLIDDQSDAGFRSHSDRRRDKFNHGRALRGRYSPNQCSAGRFLTPTAEFHLQFHHRSCAAYRSTPQFQRFLQCSESQGDQGAPANCCPVRIS